MAPINNPDFNVVTPDTFARLASAAAGPGRATGASGVLAFLDKIPQDVDDWDVEIPEDEELDRIRDLLTLAHIDATRRATMHWEVLLLECTEHLRSDALQADKGLAGFFVLVVLAACEVFLTSDRVRLTAAKDEVNNALRLFLRSRPFVSEHVELGDETLKKFRSGCVMGTTVLSMLARICLGNRAFVIPLLIDNCQTVFQSFVADSQDCIRHWATNAPLKLHPYSAVHLQRFSIPSLVHELLGAST
ncbi:hypothetical protein ACCO45_001796 [Purpureocillium lilacinum]|uniref:Uncharacterized protein n=1 Tax=Purpureocillium lilacinum TaxID=33203 RepID=A0ACC4E843_PURLI